MKVMLENSLFHPNWIGGAETVALLLARELSARGVAVDVLASTGRRDAPPRLATRTVPGVSGTVYEAPPAGLYDLLPAPGRPAPRLPVRAAHHLLNAGSPRWERLAAEALRRSRPDVLHTNTIVGLTPAVWRAARRLGVPIVHTLHDYHLLCARTTLLRSDGRLCDRAPWPCRELWRWKRRATTDVDVVTAPSRYVLDRHLAQGAFPAARTAVVPNAPEPLAAAPTPSPRVQGGGLFLGQLQVHKGVRELLGALAHVFAGPLPPGFAFEIGGAGPLAEEVAAACAALGNRCRFLGRVEGADRDAAYARAGFVVVPSRWPEVFGLVILEAGNRGLPVIAARRGGIPELVADGLTGQLVEPEAAAIAAAIARYANDATLVRRHGAAAAEAAAQYTRERQVESFLEIYEELAKRASPRASR